MIPSRDNLISSVILPEQCYYLFYICPNIFSDIYTDIFSGFR